jgi:pimeloyl-ACP methyl ester carboxylesterase
MKKQRFFSRYKYEMQAARERVLTGSQIIQTNSGPIECATAGDGPPVLVSHGAGGGWDQGLLTARMYLNDEFQAISPSRFGYLRTPYPADASPAAQAEAYADLLDALGISRGAILASSGGGPSALQFALRHSDRCSALVMVAAVSQAVPPRPKTIEIGNKVVFRSDFINWLITTYFESKVLSILGAPPELQVRLSPAEKEPLAEILRTMHPVSLRSAGMFHDAMPRRFDFPLERITAPTLVVHAVDDKVVPFAQGQYTAEKIPGARLLALPDGGHLKIGHHAEMRPEIVAFLKQHLISEKEGKRPVGDLAGSNQ